MLLGVGSQCMFSNVGKFINDPCFTMVLFRIFECHETNFACVGILASTVVARLMFLQALFELETGSTFGAWEGFGIYSFLVAGCSHHRRKGHCLGNLVRVRDVC